MKRVFLLAALAFTLGLVLAGVGLGEKGGDEQVAKELWARIQGEEYRKTWKMWPGKEPFYKGREPHGALLTTYVSDGAYDAITQRKGVMPEGAVIIKENYMPGKQLAAITVMKKIKGYNPEAGDWFWVKFLPDGRVETMESGGMEMKAAGKVGMCISCHSARADNDYLYTGDIK
ncbi:MAG: cytochrome P460 family protein [Candidatus Methanosuratincola sp.]|jgi:hypothetical protein